MVEKKRPNFLCPEETYQYQLHISDVNTIYYCSNILNQCRESDTLERFTGKEVKDCCAVAQATKECR